MGFSILGRNSVDIMKCGGYKISALEIEEVFRENEKVRDVSVLSVHSEEFGETIVAIVVLKERSEMEREEMYWEGSEELQSEFQEWCSSRLAHYKIPRKYLIWNGESLPRNTMGKVNKKELRALIDSPSITS